MNMIVNVVINLIMFSAELNEHINCDTNVSEIMCNLSIMCIKYDTI